MEDKRDANQITKARRRKHVAAPARSANRSQVSRPPYNPGLHQFVERKKEWAFALDDQAKAKGFLGWHQRGYLPHYDAPWVTQFVTLRLADSLPASRRGEWQHLLEIEDNRERRQRLETYLDRGWGECWLHQPSIATMAEEAIRFFDNQRYALAAWVVMPNHLHLLVEVWDTPLSKLVKSWKTYLAREGNKLLGRSGTFWEREYVDTRIQDEDHRRKVIKYIESNPVKAKLVPEAKDWSWSSTRFRDEFGLLKTATGRSS